MDQLKSKVPQSGQVFGGGRGGTLDKLKYKSLNMAKFQLGVGGYSGQTQIKSFHWDQVWTKSNSKVPTSLKIFISVGEILDATFLKYLSGAIQGIFSIKFLQPSLLSHCR